MTPRVCSEDQITHPLALSANPDSMGGRTNDSHVLVWGNGKEVMGDMPRFSGSDLSGLEMSHSVTHPAQPHDEVGVGVVGVMSLCTGRSAHNTWLPLNLPSPDEDVGIGAG